MITETGEVKKILIKHNALNKTMEEIYQIDTDTDLYQDLFSYYMNSGDMPYDVMKGHYGNPEEWVMNQVERLKLLKD